MFVLWAILLMAPQKEDGRPEAHNLWPYNSDAETTFLSSPHLSSHYPADRVTGTISNRYSSQAPFFFFFLPPPSAFCLLNPPPFQHPSRHALTKGCVHFTFTVCSLSDVIGLGSSPDTPCAHFYLKQQRSGNTGSGFVAGEGCGFKERAFSHLVYFSPWFLITVTTTPQFLKVPNPTPYAITTWQG